MKRMLPILLSFLLMLSSTACISDGREENTLTVRDDSPTISTPTTKHSSDNKNSDSSSSSPKVIEHYCDATGCYKEGTKKYSGFGGIEYYCSTHYEEIMDMIGKMESDVGKGSASKHTCEVCTKEGTKTITGLSGAPEYYCTEHYNEMVEILEMLLGE